MPSSSSVISLERTFDLADLRAPGSNFSLHDVDQPEKTQLQNGQNKQDHEREGRIQTIIRLQHEIAQPFIGGDKLRHDGARHRENDRYFDPGEHKRYRIREPNLLEDIELRPAVNSRQL